MKTIIFILICMLCVIALQAQSVQDFRSNYTGSTTYTAGVLTIQSSGYLKMPNGFTYPYNFPYNPNYNPNQPRQRKDYEYFIWVVPEGVKQIVINANTLVNAAFHYTHDLTIRGQDRATSIIYGTQIRGWNDCALVQIPNYNPDDYWMSAIHKTGGSQNSVIRDLTILNPKAYCVLGLNSTGKLDVYNCNFVDKRDGSISNSDGIDVGPNSIIQNCYFECGDDNIKIYNPNITVRDCTFNMIDNAGPFQLGYGAYTNGSYMNASNIRVIGNEGRYCDGNPVISGGYWGFDGSSGGNGTSHVNVYIDGLYIENPNASLVNIEDTRQSLGGSIVNANLNNSYYSGQNHPQNCEYVYENNSMTLCGQSPGNLVSCSGTQYGGSSVDSYAIPDCAKDYICQNEGNHAYALLASFIGTPAGNGIIDYSCSCTPGGQNYHQYCGSNCESCGYNDEICGGIVGVNYVPSGGCGSCSANLNVTTTYNSGNNADLEASNTITASNIINSGAVVDYDAGAEIRLINGFYAKYGCDFDAFIDGCAGAFIVSGNDDSPTFDYSATMLKITETTPVSNEVTLRNYPNPFTGITTIEYTLPQAQEVSLTISNMSGQVIRQLKQVELQEAGIYQLQFDASDLPSGVYMCTLKADLTVQIQKMTLLK